MQNLPSKKIILTFIAVAGLVFGVAFWSFGFKNEAQNGLYVAERKNLVSNLSLSPSSNDSDGDGLYDWEEALWKTDPRNPDTDGDGTPDGQETKAGRDPNIKGPDDKRKIPDSEYLDETQSAEETNLTSSFTRAFSSAIAPRLIAGGGGISPSDIETLRNYLPSADKVLDTFPQVKKDVLIISEENNSDSVKKYFNQIYAVYETTFLTLKEDDVSILAGSFLDQEIDELQLKKIDPVINAFNTSFEKVKDIPVPAGYENFALTELNYLLKSKRVVEIIRDADKDPMSAMIMLSYRISLMDEIRRFHQLTFKTLTEKNIIFSANEKGYRLLQ